MILELFAFVIAMVSVITNFLLQKIKAEDRAHGHYEPDHMYTVKGVVKKMRQDRKQEKKIQKEKRRGRR